VPTQLVLVPMLALLPVQYAFSAMTTNRAYRKARLASEALAELRRCSGTDFDPVVVEALAAAVTSST
jgi:HD-GYP domain-containing protein (c-di-GMP phosphodiesterase class II)